MREQGRICFKQAGLCLALLAFMSAPAVAFDLETPDGRTVTIAIPGNFKHVFSETDPVEIHEFVPAGETFSDWSEMITVMRMPGTYLDANGALKDYGSIKLLGYIQTCSDALMQPVIEDGSIGGQVSLSTSFACITKEEVRVLPQVDVRPYEFLSVTYVQAKDHVYEVQRAVHFDTMTEATLSAALEKNAANLQYTRDAMARCCGG
ncbi:MAG: hypothetical protein RLO08_09665 [Parvibaculaceae bacterium]